MTPNGAISWPTLDNNVKKKGNIRYRVCSENKIWRKVNTHESLWSALFGSRGAEALFLDRSSQSGQNKKYGLPRYVIVWEEEANSALLTEGTEIVLISRLDAENLDKIGDATSKDRAQAIELMNTLLALFGSANQRRSFKEYEFEIDDAESTKSTVNFHADASDAEIQGAESDPKSDEGQGIEIVSRKRKAIEDCAMVQAYLYYKKLGYEVDDTSRTKSYDLSCRKMNEEIRVEVKGTQQGPGAIFLTSGEVQHAHTGNCRVDLFIVHDIGVIASPNADDYECHGGVCVTIPSWEPEEHLLTPIQFKYSVPVDLLQSAD